MELLNDVENNEAEKAENRRKATGLKTNFYKFEFFYMTVFWTTLLERKKFYKQLEST